MNRRQFTQSLAALFATPALPSALAAAPVAAPAGGAAVFWADYLTRLHKVCTPQMLAPFLRSDLTTAQQVHAQLVAQRVLTPSGAAHHNLLSRQPKATAGQASKPRGNLSSRTQTEPAQTEPAKPKAAKMTQSSNAEQTPRSAQPDDIPTLTHIWTAGWRAGHAEHVPQALLDLRTKDSFRERLENLPLADIIVVGPVGSPRGFCALRGNEIYQLYIDLNDQGSGLAKTLLQAGEAKIAAEGHARACLNCLPENVRARAFYTKMGWQERNIELAQLDTSVGVFELACVLFEKPMAEKS